MGRKKIAELYSCKFSLNVKSKNKEILDILTEKLNLKYGPLINDIISHFCIMPPKIKKVFIGTCLDEYKRLSDELCRISNDSDEFYRRELEQERDYYLELLKLMNGGVIEEKSMKTINLKDGYLLIPNDWIVVNPENASHCLYAAVLECKNSDKYNVPHFIYCTNYKYGNQYTDEMEKEFYSLCREKWPKFSEIEQINKENQIELDPNNTRHYINAKEYLNAPIINLYSIDEKNDTSEEEFPYGAMIIRTSNECE